MLRYAATSAAESSPKYLPDSTSVATREIYRRRRVSGGEAALSQQASERRADAPDLQARDEEGQDQEEKPVSARPGRRVRKTHRQFHSIRHANQLRPALEARRERPPGLLLCSRREMSSELPSISAGFSAPS